MSTGEITLRLSKGTDSMAKTVCLNVNVMLRTLIKTLGVIAFMLSLSWKLTFLVLMEVPLTALVQNIYDRHNQVTSGGGQVHFCKTLLVRVDLRAEKCCRKQTDYVYCSLLEGN